MFSKQISFRFNIINAALVHEFKKFHIYQNLGSTIKYSFQLVPEIKNDLQTGEIKHRKHPGIRKLPPVKLPTFLQEAIYRFISNENESFLLKEARALCQNLVNRRLPVEMYEIQEKIFKTSSELEQNSENIPEVLKKTRILQLKKQIQLEIGRWKPLEYDRHECLSYLAGRATPNYASTLRVFSEIQNASPYFQPKTYFDFGSGVGSSLWAANSFWGESIKEYFCVDSASEMNDLAQDILTIENTEEKFIKNINFRQFLPASQNVQYDLVVSAFSLLDLSSAKERLQVVDTLWRKTKDILVIIEYGNNVGFSTVLDARDYILHIENDVVDQISNQSTGAHVLCPCPHDLSCPLINASKDPCGLAVAYETIFPRHRTLLKKDWISYTVLRKGKRPESYKNWPRLVKPVLKKSGHIYCNLCCKDGQIHQIISTKSKQGRHEYRSARSSALGDLLPVDITMSFKKDHVNPPDSTFNENSSFNNDVNNKE